MKKKRTLRKIRPRAATNAASRVIERLPIKKPSEASLYRKCVFYGRSGTGKTTLACTFPGKILLCDVKDDTADSIADLDNSVDIMHINTWEDIETTYWWLSKNHTQYKTVVIDTVSQLQQRCMEKVLGEKGKSIDRAGEWGTITIREWGEISSLMKIWLLRFRDLPLNVVFIAQERGFNFGEEADPELMLDPEIGPRLSPAIAANLNASVSIIGNTYIKLKIYRKEVKIKGRKRPKIEEREETQYCLRIGPNPVYTTKIRKPRNIIAPETIVDPTYEDIIDIIKGA